MGVVVLGIGVALGWGAAHWMDDDRGRDVDRVGAAKLRLPAEDDGEWSKDRKGKGGWEKGWMGPRIQDGEGPYRGDLVPDEIWERVESLLAKVEELVERVSDYVINEEGIGALLEEFFESGPFPGGDLWSDDERKPWFDREDHEGGDSYPDDGSAFGPDDEWAGPLGRFGFSFGELLPGLTLPEDCDPDFEMISEILEDLPNLTTESDQNPDDLPGLFGQIEELFEKVCEAPTE